MDGDSQLLTILVSVVTSSVVAALLTGVLAGWNERRKQLRERRMLLAGDFAGEAMEDLGQLRYYRPTKRTGHRNEVLHEDPSVREERARAVRVVIDRLRPMRGRVWVTFPGRSSAADIKRRGSRTTADWAEAVIARLRDMEEDCTTFWRLVAERPTGRSDLEREWTAHYERHRDGAWEAVDSFARAAAKVVER